jgi:hypothetical protein
MLSRDRVNVSLPSDLKPRRSMCATASLRVAKVFAVKYAIGDYGWPQGRERMNELRAKIGEIELRPQDRRRRMVRADMGDVLDIHQVYASPLAIRRGLAWSTQSRHTGSRVPLTVTLGTRTGL